MLEITVFICGAVVMILELTGSRIMAPFLGTSLVVWTGLIGVVLASLSLGYWWGGRLADQRPTMSRLSWIIFWAGVGIALTAIIQAPVLRALQATVSNLHLSVLLGTVILFAPASILLGMIAPYAVRMKLASLEHSGAIVGRMYALSTIGSIVGTFLAGFVLLSFIGSLAILFLLGAVMALLALALAPRSGMVLKIGFLVVLAVLVWLHIVHKQAMASRGFIDVDTAYNRIVVAQALEETTGRRLQIMTTGPGWFQSAMYLDDPLELVLPYTRFFRLGEFYVPDFRRVLMIGGGGYSFPKYLLTTREDLELDVVEIDPAFTELARKYFQFTPDGPDDRIRVHHLDARRFLNQDHPDYDVAILDAFNSHYSIPFQLATRQAMERISANLADHGVLLVNVISAISGSEGRFFRALLATMEEVFDQVEVFPVTEADNPLLVQNIVLAARKTENHDQQVPADQRELATMLENRWTRPIPRDLPVLTDALAPVERYLH